MIPEYVLDLSKFHEIPGFNGLYYINKNGTVKSISRVVRNRWGNGSTIKEKFLKPYNHKSGYIYIQLGRNNYKLHRLLAATFIPNIHNKPMINHLNGLKNDNSIENLEWCDNGENVRHAVKIGLLKGRFGEDNPNYHKRGKLSPLYGMTRGKNMYAKKVINTETGKIYGCAQDVCDEFGLSLGMLRHRLNGNAKNNTTFKYL